MHARQMSLGRPAKPGVVQFEREMMLERQRDGVAKAKGEGKYTARKPTARAKADAIKARQAKGFSIGEIAKRPGIGKG